MTTPHTSAAGRTPTLINGRAIFLRGRETDHSTAREGGIYRGARFEGRGKLPASPAQRIYPLEFPDGQIGEIVKNFVEKPLLAASQPVRLCLLDQVVNGLLN